MATRLYFHEAGTAPITVAVDSAWESSAAPFASKPLVSATQAGDTLTTTSGFSSTSGQDRCHRQFISQPMAGGITFNTGTTYKCYAQVLESASNDNIVSRLGIRIVSFDGTVVRQTIKSVADYSTGTEWNTSIRNKAFADGDAGTGSYTTVAGDRLVVEIGHSDSSGVSISASSRWGSITAGTTDLGENETSTSTTERPWFETSATVTFITYFEGSGAAALSAFAASGSGTETFTGTGSAACSAFAASGSGTVPFTGTGSAACSPFAASGSGTETFTGTGSAACSTFAASGSGGQTFTGTGSAALSPFAASGSGAEAFTGTGSAAMSPFAASGSGAIVAPPLPNEQSGGEFWRSGNPPATLEPDDGLGDGGAWRSGQTNIGISEANTPPVPEIVVSETQAAQTDAATGGLLITGAVSESQAAQTDATTGKVLLVAALSESQASQTDAAAARVPATGSLSEAQAAQTDLATTVQIITGTLSESQAAQTDAATGTLPISGSVAESHPAQTDSTTGKLLLFGALSESQAAQTDSTTGKAIATGSLSESQAAQTDSASALAILTGSLSENQAAQTDAETGKVLLFAAVSEANSSQTDAETGIVIVSGSISESNAAQIDAIGTSAAVHGVVAESQAAQTDSATGGVRVSAAISESQAAQTDAATAGVFADGSGLEVPPAQTDEIEGTSTPGAILNENQAAQTDAVAGGVKITASLSEAQAAQTDAASGKLRIVGVVSESQAALTDAATAKAIAAGTLAENQAAQTDLASGVARISGALSESQAAQTDNALGDASSDAFGVLSESQAAQTDAATGGVRIVGSISESNAVQTDAATGRPIVRGASVETNSAQTDAATGGPIVRGSVAETQSTQSETVTAKALAKGALVEVHAVQVDTAVSLAIVSGSFSESNANQTENSAGIVFTNSAHLIETEAPPVEQIAAGVIISGGLVESRDEQNDAARGRVLAKSLRRTKNMVKNFPFNEENRSKVILGPSVRLEFGANRLILKASSPFPLTANLYAKTTLFAPKSVKAWLSFSASYLNKTNAAGETVTSVGFRLSDDGITEYWWDGMAWSAASPGDWNDEITIADHIGVFKATKRALQVIINLQTTDGNFTPEVYSVQVAWASSIEYQEDYIARSLLPALREEIRPIGRVQVTAGAGGLIEVDLDDIETPYQFATIDSVYNLTNDPSELEDQFNGYDDETHVVQLQDAAEENDQILVYFTYIPVVAVRTSQEYVELSRTPSIVLESINIGHRKRIPIGEGLISKSDFIGYQLTNGYQADIDLTLLVSADKEFDMVRIANALVEFFDDKLLHSVGQDAFYTMRLVSPFDSHGAPNAAEVHTGRLRARIVDAVFYPTGAKQVFGTRRMVITGGNLETTIS